MLGTFALEGPESCSGLPVRRYSAASLAEELGRDVQLVETLTEDHRTPAGKLQRFLYGHIYYRIVYISRSRGVMGFRLSGNHG